MMNYDVVVGKVEYGKGTLTKAREHRDNYEQTMVYSFDEYLKRIHYVESVYITGHSFEQVTRPEIQAISLKNE
ncbi:hypothetical protein AC249_AIPGENE24095 [Exaiptasia diaphana]|nr:hypothetical protein AC249_AIPGENE24095 [Exaiptasia diaphana]